MKASESQNNRRILVIDDNSSIHADFKKILESHADEDHGQSQAAAAFLRRSPVVAPRPLAFEVASAYQGQEGLELTRLAVDAQRPFAMAFVDVRMPPGWDGIETTSRLWQVDPDLQIVICTAYSDYSWEDMSARFDAKDRMLILKKPFDMSEVLQMAHTLTAKWRLAQEARWRLQDLDRMVNERTQELRTANQQLFEAQKLKAVGQLAGATARDFSALLAVVLENARSVLGESDQISELTRDRLRQITAAGERAGRLTHQLLSFSHKQTMVCQPVDVNELVSALIAKLEAMITGPVHLKCECAAALPRVAADRAQIEQALTDLIHNARDAMPTGGVVRLATELVQLDSVPKEVDVLAGQFVCISVVDAGKGIEPDQLQHIFEPFAASREPGQRATLGLAAASGIVKQHRGWISVASQPGHGSTFKVFLPVA